MGLVNHLDTSLTSYPSALYQIYINFSVHLNSLKQALSLLAPVMVMRIEGMEYSEENSSGSSVLLAQSDSFFLPPSSCFGDLFVEVKEIKQDPVEAAEL